MKFRIISDLHLNELDEQYTLPSLSTDKETILIIAGDLCHLDKPDIFLPFLKDVSNRFKEVFIIEGNHEFWNSNIDNVSYVDIIDKNNLKNVNSNRLILNDKKIAIIGRTLWTNFDDYNPITEIKSLIRLQDFEKIRIGHKNRQIRVKDIEAIHEQEKSTLFDEIDEYIKDGFKIIAVSHHHPSLKSLSPKYGNFHGFNHDLATNIENKIKKRPEIEYWCCGHIHGYMEYDINHTHLICNPKGHKDDKTGWNPNLTFEI